jgi:hypothetical protein
MHDGACGEQTAPQAPQLAGSLLSSAQMPPHSVSPGAQAIEPVTV